MKIRRGVSTLLSIILLMSTMSVTAFGAEFPAEDVMLTGISGGVKRLMK